MRPPRSYGSPLTLAECGGRGDALAPPVGFSTAKLLPIFREQLLAIRQTLRWDMLLATLAPPSIIVGHRAGENIRRSAQRKGHSTGAVHRYLHNRLVFFLAMVVSPSWVRSACR